MRHRKKSHYLRGCSYVCNTNKKIKTTMKKMYLMGVAQCYHVLISRELDCNNWCFPPHRNDESPHIPWCSNSGSRSVEQACFIQAYSTETTNTGKRSARTKNIRSALASYKVRITHIYSMTTEINTNKISAD